MVLDQNQFGFIQKEVGCWITSTLNFFKMCKTTITVEKKDKKLFKDLANKHDINQQELFSVMIKIMKTCDFELKESLK